MLPKKINQKEGDKYLMNIYSGKNINIISFFIAIIIFFIINLVLNNFSKTNFESSKLNQNIQEDKINNKIQENIISEKNQEKEYDWYIQIDSISLKAPIAETTEMDVLSKYIRHFEDTDLEEGNVGLAAHNRGYEVNYFENLKSVKIGDEIKYYYNDFEMTYIIDTIEIIKNTDWSYLEEKTNKNKITLITCVENEPKYRRCVQATQKE